MYGGLGRVRPGESTHDSVRPSPRAPPGGASTICLSEHSSAPAPAAPSPRPGSQVPALSSIFGEALEGQPSPHAAPDQARGGGQPGGRRSHSSPQGSKLDLLGDTLAPEYAPWPVLPAGQPNGTFGEPPKEPANRRSWVSPTLKSHDIFNEKPVPRRKESPRAQNNIFEDAPAAETASPKHRDVGQVSKFSRRKNPGGAAAYGSPTIDLAIDLKGARSSSAPSKAPVPKTQVSDCLNDEAPPVTDPAVITAANMSWIGPPNKIQGRLRGEHAQQHNKCTAQPLQRCPGIVSRGCTDWRGPLARLHGTDEPPKPVHPHLRSDVNIGEPTVDSREIPVISAGCRDSRRPVGKLSTTTQSYEVRRHMRSSVCLAHSAEDAQSAPVTSAASTDRFKPPVRLSTSKKPNPQLQSSIQFAVSPPAAAHPRSKSQGDLLKARLASPRASSAAGSAADAPRAVSPAGKVPPLQLNGARSSRASSCHSFERAAAALDLRSSAPKPRKGEHPSGSAGAPSGAMTARGPATSRAHCNLAQRKSLDGSTRTAVSSSTTTSTRHEGSSLRSMTSPRQSFRRNP